MREQLTRKATTLSCVKDVKDSVVNGVTRARHARACTADKREPFTSFTDTKDQSTIHAAIAQGAATILALDLGQRTGWAVRNREGAIASGTHEFRPGRFEGGGMVWLRFSGWLREVEETSGGIGVVVFEEVRRHLGTTAAHALGGYLAHLTAWAEANKIPYRGVPVGTIKRHVTGKGNADKQAVIDAVRRLGFAPADDNEADALALLHWAIVQGIGGAR